MIVKELELTNIRSYQHALIKFPLGKTLFEGDIGSGKSTILMALEFVLFGLGSESGSSLLKLGEEEGRVKVTLDVEGRQVGVERGLKKKGNSVHQTEGKVSTLEEDLDLSPSELKERILEVLEFNEAPDPKAQSLIYRYAVYTPQEEMKEILSMRPDLRLQTLRRAFRVEDYKTAAENAEGLERELRSDIRALDALAFGLAELRAQLKMLLKEEGEREQKISELTRSEAGLDSELKELKSEWRSLHEAQLGLERLKAERGMQERLLSEATREAKGILKEIDRLQERIAKSTSMPEAEDCEAPQSGPTVQQLKAREGQAEGELRELTAMKAAAESKLSDYSRISAEGICPLCDRPILEHDFSRQVASKEAEKAHAEAGLAKAEEVLVALRRQREQAEKLDGKRELARERLAQKTLDKEEVLLKKDELASAKSKIDETTGIIKELEESLAHAEGLEEKVQANNRKIADLEERQRSVRNALATEQEALRQSVARRAELSIEVEKKGEASRRREHLKEVQIWIGDYFLPSVSLIEKSVMSTINQEFGVLLEKWFGMLVSDPEKAVSIDEEFTPMVSQGGYEQDLRYLSGGERTSVALAYRLALNSLVQKTSVGMKSNLLVLDEPTDGFSQEQLGNVREVLDETGCSQVIIVSHDKELESFADQVFKVEKEQGRSTVRLAGA